MFEAHRPSVVLVDLLMPQMSGLEFIADAGLSRSDLCSVIVITGAINDSGVKECYEAGIRAFIRKPFNIYDVRGAVHNAVMLRQLSSRIEESSGVSQLTSSTV